MKENLFSSRIMFIEHVPFDDMLDQYNISVWIKRFAAFAIKHVLSLFYSVSFADFDLYLDVSIKNGFMVMYVCISHGFHASYFTHILRKTTIRLIYGGRLTVNLNWNGIICSMPPVQCGIPELAYHLNKRRSYILTEKEIYYFFLWKLD